MKALVSLYDKTGPFPLIGKIHEMGIPIIATAGTAKALAAWGIGSEETKVLTGFSDVLDGGIKTIHPAVHEAVATGDIGIVIVGLMPVGDPGAHGLSRMDLGGVLLLRSAIKHHDSVIAIACPTGNAAHIVAALEGAAPLPETRRRCALESMEAVVAYEKATLKRLRDM